MRVISIERGSFPNVFVTFLAHACVHCAQPSCIPACPAGAISRQADGVVVLDREKCLGRDSCGMPCFVVCPYESPQFGEEENPKMQKCNLCQERWLDDRKPVCVEACPTRALDAGPMDELIAKYGDLQQVEGFIYSPELGPSIVFKALRARL
jgi:anaerobic dimethyl sulfoxide reductase subunit B (iron-sulfur subunit)